MQPWDDWGGYKSLPTAEWTEGDFATIDELARLTLAVDADFEAFSSFVQGNERIEVPAEFIAND